MSEENGIYIIYNCSNQRKNKYRVNINNEIVRELSKIYQRENKIPVYCPFDDKRREDFEDIVIRADIKDNDSLIIAIKKFKTTMALPKRGYTAADVRALRDKLLNKEVN